MDLKSLLLLMTGIGGALLSKLLGGLDHTVLTVFIFMAVDFAAGIVCAAAFKSSPKSKSGGLTSNACFKGICRKGMIFLIIIIAHRLDIEAGSNYIRDGVCIAFTASEGISIIEMAGLMGVPIPAVVKKAVEVLRDKGYEQEH